MCRADCYGILLPAEVDTYQVLSFYAANSQYVINNVDAIQAMGATPKLSYRVERCRPLAAYNAWVASSRFIPFVMLSLPVLIALVVQIAVPVLVVTVALKSSSRGVCDADGEREARATAFVMTVYLFYGLLAYVKSLSSLPRAPMCCNR